MDRTLADPLTGTMLEGRYRIRGRIARGGMATVYDAVDERLERTVAVKIMHPGYAADPSFVSRFIGEARAAAALSHPHVVAVYDQGVHDGLAFLVMEQVAGRTLRDVLVSRGRLPASEAIALLEPVLDALAAAHRHGMIHRDVKPENVLIGADGRAVKVADFGLARAVTSIGPTSTRGVVMGTVAYVAPEQITAGKASTRSDVYSAGIMLFEMLTGTVPYGGESSVNVAFQHVHTDVPAPSSRAPMVPPPLDELTLRATSRDPAGRPADAGAFLAELRSVRDEIEGRIQRGPSVSAIPASQNGRPTSTFTASAAVPTMRGQHTQHTQVVPRPGVQQRGTAMLPQDMLLPGEGHQGNHVAGYPPGRGSRPRHRVGMLVAAVVVLALIAVGAGWYLSAGQYTTAPSLVNLSQSEAVASAQSAGFKIQIVTQFDDMLTNRIFRQNPPAGTKIHTGGTITAYVSKGPNLITVPRVTGLTKAAAQAAIVKAGLKDPKVNSDTSDTVPAGMVISSSPQGGQRTQPATLVTIVVSTGKQVTLPDLRGKTKEEAQQTLTNLGLKFQITVGDNNDPAKAGLVLDQLPLPNTVSSSTVVSLTVAAGQASVRVPDVTGKNFDEAKQALEALGLRVKRVGFGDDGSPVLFTSPGADSQVAPNTEITVGIAGG